MLVEGKYCLVEQYSQCLQEQEGSGCSLVLVLIEVEDCYTVGMQHYCRYTQAVVEQQQVGSVDNLENEIKERPQYEYIIINHYNY